jgi:hypothetical protein
VARRRNQSFRLAAALLLLSSAGAGAEPRLAEAGQVNTIKEAFERLGSCWRPPPASSASPMDITVIVSFTRAGDILGRPRITYESEQATDDDRLQYRIAVMEALQRCAPMPFTESMGGAVAGHPFAVRFRNRKSNPQPTEKRAWLTPKTL